MNAAEASYRPRLFAPGPVEVPPQVLTAMSRPVVHHRSADFAALFVRVRERLAEVTLVPGEDVMILTGSGTAAFEAGLLACVPVGATVLALRNGKFGERWAGLARRFGYRVVEVAAPWGRGFDANELERALTGHPDVAAVTVVHSETSTGQLNDVRALAGLVRERAPEALVLVDAVTSLSAAELRPKRWDLDGVFSGSQKGLMLPPGLAFAWLSERAWQRHEQVRDRLPPSHYLDLARERRNQRKGQTAYTPAVNLVYGLEVALALLLSEGIERVWWRRERTNRALLAAGEAVGCEPYAERPSPAVAALRTPAGIAAPDLVAGFARRGVTIAGGQDEAKQVLIRPSLLGYADAFDALTVAAALEGAMRDLGREVPLGSAVTAAMRVLEAD